MIKYGKKNKNRLRQKKSFISRIPHYVSPAVLFYFGLWLSIGKQQNKNRFRPKKSFISKGSALYSAAVLFISDYD